MILNPIRFCKKLIAGGMWILIFTSSQIEHITVIIF